MKLLNEPIADIETITLPNGAKTAGKCNFNSLIIEDWPYAIYDIIDKVVFEDFGRKYGVIRIQKYREHDDRISICRYDYFTIEE